MFPAGFVWGVGTSAPQIEGGVDLDGRGPSIWDAFAETGAVRAGDTPAIATDHRRRFAEDVGLLGALGVDAYRFSIAWPRVQPTGVDGVSHSGLDFYRALVDELLAHDIEPVATLYHWDLPVALEQTGGWPSRDTALRFGEHAAIMAEALGDRVRRWGTVNEPWCASMLGYAAGVHAPGRREPSAAVAAAHHLLLGHGLAVDALRAAVPDAEVSITLNPYPVVAAGPTDDDRDAARRVDGLANRLWYDAVLEGHYPDDVLDDLRAVSDLAHVRDGDLAQIARPLDALGINYYRRYHVRHRPGASATGPAAQWPGSPDVELVTPEAPLTDGGWAIEPGGLTEALVAVTREHRPPPLYVHEAGAAFEDPVDAGSGRVEDTRRVTWLADHLSAAAAAIEQGVDLRGFFVWSLLDNFEWAEGYAHQFGLVHVDRTTLQRTPKASARWYAEVVARNALVEPG
ncbi:MAG TPA: GH1 family beta-glucosidase [Acidimicrobiales bacterium]|nr:GH1 family beta-glucosidase [Acidimicrobiales bacterium]